MFSIEKVLAFALNDDSSFSLLRESITNDLAISNPYYLQICKFYAEFYSKHKVLPQKGDLQIWLSSQKDNQRMMLRSALEHIKSQDISNYTKDYVIENAVNGLKKVATKNAIKRLDSLEDPDPNVMSEMLKQVEKIRVANLTNIINIRDVDKWLLAKDDFEIKYQTGIQKLDKLIGGFGEELVFLLAGTGIGKTTALINMAKHVAFQGGNVLHITLELFDKATAHRYYRRISEAQKNEFTSNYSEVKQYVENWLSWMEGDIHIVYYPAFSISVADVKNIVRQYVEEYGDVDLVIIDYLDLLSSDTGYGNLDSWAKLGRMSHEIRSLCPEYGTTVASAAQANREGLDATQLKLKHMAGSVQKLQAADLVFGLMQDEDELEMNQGRLGVLKVRESGGRGEELPLYIDLDRMMILDLDHPDARRIQHANSRREENAITQQLYSSNFAV